MMFYTVNDDTESPVAVIHNVDTGITYRLDLQIISGVVTPVVEMMTPEQLTGKRLFRGAQAVEFWRALLYCNPWNGAAGSPREFLDRLAGVTQKAAGPEDAPF